MKICFAYYSFSTIYIIPILLLKATEARRNRVLVVTVNAMNNITNYAQRAETQRLISTVALRTDQSISHIPVISRLDIFSTVSAGAEKNAFTAIQR